MKQVILYGELAERFGKHHRFAVKNAAEAIRALKANHKGFEQFMCRAHQRGIGFRMFVGGSKVRDYKEIHYPAGKAEVIRLVPVIAGSKDGLLGILLGTALIIAAVAGAIPTFGGSLAALPTAVGMLGVSMVIGGVSTLLTSPPGIRDQNNGGSDRTSHIFTGPVNTSLQGKAVPVGYGRLIIGSCVISAGIKVADDS